MSFKFSVFDCGVSRGRQFCIELLRVIDPRSVRIEDGGHRPPLQVE